MNSFIEKLQCSVIAFILFVHIFVFVVFGFCVFFPPKGITVLLILMYIMDKSRA